MPITANRCTNRNELVPREMAEELEAPLYSAREEAKECVTCPLRGLEHFSMPSAEQSKTLARARRDTRTISAGSAIAHEGDVTNQIYTVKTGWAFSYTLLEDGRRQIFSIYLPGDVICLQAYLSRFMDHGVEAINNVQLCPFDVHRLRDPENEAGELRDAIARLFDIERWQLQQRIAGIGRKSAPESLAFLLLDIFLRLRRRELTYGNACAFPLTQTVMADALGLSPEHLNRLLKHLRDDNIASVGRGKMVIHDLAGLSRLARYEDTIPHIRPLF